MPHTKDGAVTAAAKVFWRTRHFWALASLIIVTCLLVGYLIGNWVAANDAKMVIAQQERAYKEAGDARKAVMQQCLTNNASLTAKLTTLGDKTATALDKLADDTAQDKKDPVK